MSGQPTKIFTIGHSNRSLELFVEMLRGAGVDIVIDVRSFPRSRANSQFNVDVLPGALSAYQIGYEHWLSLGGRRKVQPSIDQEANRLWENRSFHNYADYALSDEFERSIEALIELAQRQFAALMCSEAVWWRCHRRIIADHLLARGMDVLHIMDIGKIVPAKITPGAVVTPDLRIKYPAPSLR